MSYSSAVKSYQDTHAAVQYADDHQLIQMLYDTLIDRMNQAHHLLVQGDTLDSNQIGQKGALISKAIFIVEALKAYLNEEQGGQIAVNLRALYDYIEHQLFEANYKNDASLLLETKQLVEEVRSGWIGIRQDALVYLKESFGTRNEI